MSRAEWRGVLYAFGRGIDPRRKDGVRAHPLVFASGMLMHLGIFAAIAQLGALATGFVLPPVAAAAIAASILAGLFAALALVVRRLRSPVLQIVSTADDYTSSLLVVLFLATAEASLLTESAGPAFLVASIALALYAPFGKIRHCVLFFATRARFGLFVGRRGVMGTRPGGA